MISAMHVCWRITCHHGHWQINLIIIFECDKVLPNGIRSENSFTNLFNKVWMNLKFSRYKLESLSTIPIKVSCISPHFGYFTGISNNAKNAISYLRTPIRASRTNGNDWLTYSSSWVFKICLVVVLTSLGDINCQAIHYSWNICEIWKC